MHLCSSMLSFVAAQFKVCGKVMCVLHLESIRTLRVYPRKENVISGIRVSRITNDLVGGILHPHTERGVCHATTTEVPLVTLDRSSVCAHMS
jgi:hypothetical protein